MQRVKEAMRDVNIILKIYIETVSMFIYVYLTQFFYPTTTTKYKKNHLILK